MALGGGRNSSWWDGDVLVLLAFVCMYALVFVLVVVLVAVALIL